MLNYISETLGISDFDESKISTVNNGTSEAIRDRIPVNASDEVHKQYQNIYIVPSL